MRGVNGKIVFYGHPNDRSGYRVQIYRFYRTEQEWVVSDQEIDAIFTGGGNNLRSWIERNPHGFNGAVGLADLEPTIIPILGESLYPSVAATRKFVPEWSDGK